MADENTTPKVDESSIARPDPARRNSLEKQLSHRPERSELIESEHAQYCFCFFRPGLVALLVSLVCIY